MILGYLAKGYIVWEHYIFAKLISRCHECSIMSYPWLYSLLQLINWINFILDIITNCIEASLGRTSNSLWTNLAKGKSGVSKWY